MGIRGVIALLWGGLLLLCATTAKGQNGRISGLILDSQKKPVPGATIMLSADSASRQPARYTMANTRGEFTLDGVVSTAASVVLVARALGYTTQRRVLSREQLSQAITITLAEEAVEIDRVVVVVKTKDMYAKGDTTVFNIHNYRLGNENSMGEVLRKMPGMHVDQGGM